MLFLVIPYDSLGHLLGVRDRYGKVELVKIIIGLVAATVTPIVLVVNVPVVDCLLLESLESVSTQRGGATGLARVCGA
jgi:hypothetical protein